MAMSVEARELLRLQTREKVERWTDEIAKCQRYRDEAKERGSIDMVLFWEKQIREYRQMLLDLLMSHTK